jgi:hypothetical protein
MRRVTYSLLTSALKAKDSCAAAAAASGSGGGKCGVGRFDVIGAVKGVRRRSAKALADAEAGIPAAAAEESAGDAEDKEAMLVSAVERLVIMKDAGAAAAEDAARGGVGVTAEGFEDVVNGATRRADADDGAAEREWIAAVRRNAADASKGFFRNAGVRIAADDKDLPPPGYLRHDLGAELAFPEVYGVGRKFFRAVNRGGRGLAFLTPKVGRDYASCAIVGNSQTMLTVSRGSEIDAHGVVVRLNNAPTLGFERFVGGRTTHRLLNGVWTQRYGLNAVESNYVANIMPLEVGVTAVATRALPKDYNNLGDALRARGRKDVNLARLSDELIARSGEVLKTLRDRLETMRGVEGGAAGRENDGNGVPYAGKASPSSGFVSIFFLLQMCSNVTAYGIGADNDGHARSANWHYWENANYYATSREFGDAPHHSWELERDVMAAFDAGLPGFRLVGPNVRGSGSGSAAGGGSDGGGGGGAGGGGGGRGGRSSRRRGGAETSDLKAGAELGETAADLIFKANQKLLTVRQNADKACAAVSTTRCGCSDPADAGAGLLTAAGKSTSGRNQGVTRLTWRQENAMFAQVAKKHDELIVLKAVTSVAGKTAPAGGGAAPKAWNALLPASASGAGAGGRGKAAKEAAEDADDAGGGEEEGGDAGGGGDDVDAGDDSALQGGGDPDARETGETGDGGGAHGGGGVFSRFFGHRGRALTQSEEEEEEEAPAEDEDAPSKEVEEEIEQMEKKVDVAEELLQVLQEQEE